MKEIYEEAGKNERESGVEMCSYIERKEEKDGCQDREVKTRRERKIEIKRKWDRQERGTE